MKALLFLLFELFKFAKIGKIILPALSLVASLGTYALLYGWRFAAGFIGLLFFHEMGHYIAARQKNLNVGLPTFIPFVGAWIELKEQPVDAEAEAYIAYAGPFVGSLAAFAFYFWGSENNSGLALALAQAGFMINLFNLIPLYPLDGGRITSVLSPRLWFLGAPLLVGFWLYHPSPMLIIVAVLAFPQLFKAWNYDSASQEYKNYYNVKNSTKFEYTFLYLTLAIVLAVMIGK